VDLPPGTADIQQAVFARGNRATYALVVVTPQVVAHRDAHRLLHELNRSTAVVLGGAVPDQVAAYEQLARHIQEALSGGDAERVVS